MNIIRLAEDMGVCVVGFADHIWENKSAEPSDWYRPQDENNILRLRSELLEISSQIQTLAGCEADTAAPGIFSISAEFAEKLDYVLLSCSHFHMRDFVEQPASHAPEDIARQLMKFFVSGVGSGLASSIAHPFVPFGHTEKFDSIIKEISDSEFLDAFGEAASRGVGLEITTKFLPDEGNVFSIETPVRMLSLAKQAGCLFTFGTDAHNPECQRKLYELEYFSSILELSESNIHPAAIPAGTVLQPERSGR